MRKEISFYLRNRKIRNIIIISLIFLFLFILINGVFIYAFKKNNSYFYVLEKIIPYPAYSVGGKIITIGEYEDLVNLNKRIYELAYRVDFSESEEGKKNLQILRSNIKKELIDKVIIENILKSMGQSITDQDVNKEYNSIIKNIGPNQEISNIIQYTSGIQEKDVKEKIYENLINQRIKENVIYNLKMKVLVVKPNDSAKQEDWDEIQKTAEMAVEDLKQNPASFDKYALLYSDKNDYLVQNFGKDYYFEDDLPESFRDAFNSFTIGSIGGPIKGDNGYYIFDIEDKKGYYKGSLEDFLKEQEGKFKVRYFLL